MPQIRKIYNRFGELESFDRKKIVGSILGAIRIAGRSDEWIADKLAPMIELALANRFEEDSPTVDDIAYFVEQSLRAIEDLHDVAEAYVNNRSRSNTLRELEEEAPNNNNDGPQVTPLARGELLGWDRSRIEAALVREENLSISQARVVAAAVEGVVCGRAAAHLRPCMGEDAVKEARCTYTPSRFRRTRPRGSPCCRHRS